MLIDFAPFQAGVSVADPTLQVFNGQEVELWPRIAWSPKWALTFSDVRKKVGGDCSVSQRSTLAIKGTKVYIEGLSLDGALVVNSVDEAEVRLFIERNLSNIHKNLVEVRNL